MNKNASNKIFVLKGQAVLIVLLIMVVALTIGVSISLRSTRNVGMSTTTEESQRAFSAAEAGLEAILSGGAPVGTLSSAGDPQTVEYSATKGYYGSGQEFIFPEKIARDDTRQVWFVSHDPANNYEVVESCSVDFPCYTTNSIYICWGNQDSVVEPAIEATLIYKTGGEYKIRKYAFDNTALGRGNNFSSANLNTGFTICSSGKYYALLNFPSADIYLALRLRLLYNSEKQILAVKSTGVDLPYQGEVYNSTGTVRTAGSNEAEVRTLEFKKAFPYLPGIFDFALYSGGAISK